MFRFSVLMLGADGGEADRRSLLGGSFNVSPSAIDPKAISFKRLTFQRAAIFRIV